MEFLPPALGQFGPEPVRDRVAGQRVDGRPLWVEPRRAAEAVPRPAGVS